MTWEILKLIGKPIVVTIHDSIRIVLFPDQGSARAIYYFHFNKPEIATTYKTYLSDGMVYVDCGANIGVYSTLAAKCVGEKGDVYSFEPQPRIYNRLVANIHLNGFTNVHPVQTALGDSEGFVELIEEADHVASYARPLSDEMKMGNRCQVTSLDAYFGEHPIKRLDILKIDVEGFEIRVLSGARATISKFKPSIIQFEYFPNYPNLPSEEWPTLPRFREILGTMGYDEIYYLNSTTAKLEKLRDHNAPTNDLFSVHKDRRQQLDFLFQEID